MTTFFLWTLILITTSLPFINSHSQYNYYINEWNVNYKQLQYSMSHCIAGLTSNITTGQYQHIIEILKPGDTSESGTPQSQLEPGSYVFWTQGMQGMYGQFDCTEKQTDRGLCGWESVYSPNSMVVLNHAMYFSLYPTGSRGTGSEYITTTNFYKHTLGFTDTEITNFTTIQMGTTYPKPAALFDECYTTDNVQYIYLIGGRTNDVNVGGSSNAFMIFDTLHYQWSTGPTLHKMRASSACVYHTNTSTIYVFGGDDTTAIEKWREGSSYWQIAEAELNATTRSIYAFEVKNSNTIFIVGVDKNGGICYAFYVDKEETYFCINTPQNTMHFGAVYVSEQMTFYSIAGMFLPSGENSQNVQFTKVSTTAPLSLSNVGRSVSSNTKIPIQFAVSGAYKTRSQYDGDIKLKFAKIILYSLELDINNTVFLRNVSSKNPLIDDYNCSVCVSPNMNCTTCLDGITMKYAMPYNKKQVRNNVFHVDTICVPNTYALATGFDVIITDMFFITFSLPRTISYSHSTIYVKPVYYQLEPNTNYTFLLSTDNPAVTFDANVKIATTSSDVMLCHIINYRNISKCNDGFVPVIDFKALKKYHNTFNIVVKSAISNKLIDIYPVNVFKIQVQPWK